MTEEVEVFQGPWVCFHCGEVCNTRTEAMDHFGYDESEMPGCIAILKEGEKAILEDRREWRHRALQEESANERLACERNHLYYSIWEVIRKECKKQRSDHISEVENLRWVWETMEGRALAAEDALNAAPKWLRRFLRWRAEKLGMAKLKARTL